MISGKYSNITFQSKCTFTARFCCWLSLNLCKSLYGICPFWKEMHARHINVALLLQRISYIFLRTEEVAVITIKVGLPTINLCRWCSSFFVKNDLNFWISKFINLWRAFKRLLNWILYKPLPNSDKWKQEHTLVIYKLWNPKSQYKSWLQQMEEPRYNYTYFPRTISFSSSVWEATEADIQNIPETGKKAKQSYVIIM